jgi:ATP-dependent Lhr-like helicase
MSDRGAAAALRQRLNFAWRPFFARFGRLTEAQLATIPHILDGTNVTLIAPTASGKTEAIAAPVAQRHRDQRWEGLAVAYIVPTRALANDTLIRVGGPVSDMGFRIDLKHGDRPSLARNLDWLITTPESLDSLIARRGELLRDVRCIILDEIHLLDNTYRGDQLRVLLARLRALTGVELATHLISATLPDPAALAQRYVANSMVISVSGQRNVTLQFAADHSAMKALAKQHSWRKLLYFCNKREQVEAVAGELVEVWRPYPVVAHHGSLSKHQREEAEQVLREQRVAVGVATSTLEVGIDIGDIDAVILADLPWSCSALMQRIGRGNRRSGQIQVVGLGMGALDQAVLSSMLEASLNGAIFAEEYTLDRSVAIQQIISLLFQHRGGGLPTSALAPIMSCLVDENQLSQLLEHLEVKQMLVRHASRWFLSTGLLDEAERGAIHSNIPDTTIYRVIDVDSTREIGSIVGLFDNVFLLGSAVWQVVDVRFPIIRARRYRGTADSALFKRHPQSGRYYRFLPTSLR